jgi:hypothetical protein
MHTDLAEAWPTIEPSSAATEEKALGTILESLDASTGPLGQKPAAHRRLDGIVIGVFVGFGDRGDPLINFPGNIPDSALSARATVTLRLADVGREVALMFEGGDPQRPIVLGLIQHPAGEAKPDDRAKEGASRLPLEVQVDQERTVLTADKEIVLRCGKASITLTRAGKIIIRGAYLLSRSSGVNRIKGGSVQIN